MLLYDVNNTILKKFTRTEMSRTFVIDNTVALKSFDPDVRFDQVGMKMVIKPELMEADKEVAKNKHGCDCGRGAEGTQEALPRVGVVCKEEVYGEEGWEAPEEWIPFHFWATVDQGVSAQVG